MPPKGKAAQKPKPSPTTPNPPSEPPKPQTTTATKPPPSTISERSTLRVAESRPFDDIFSNASFHQAPRDHQVPWFCVRFARKPLAQRNKVAQRSARDYWKVINDGSLAIRALPVEQYKWGRDRNGRDIGTYSEAQLRERRDRRAWLTVLEGESRVFRLERPNTYEEAELETSRRREMAELRQQLYGGGRGGSLSTDPEWDDVMPIPAEEPEGALAAISYPEEYAEAMSYLRAVMMAKEYSPRCLRLTEKIIGMNPAHYTVWLYRAAIITARGMPVLEEIEWLNEIALAHLKNYQIWHHRHLLVDNYYPTIAKDKDKVAEFAALEREFLKEILAEDTKNYHVWSYRSYLVDKLGVWDSKEELEAIEELIDDDVRNNSAWSHRFFLVFSNPAHSTPGVAATQVDPKVPADLVDREIAYAKEKIDLAPQNQSPWNYLRGVLVKGGRKLAEVEDFTQGFVKGLGEKGANENVQSTHALDLLAEIHAEKGEKDQADLCLRRLGEKWDQIRVGYWEWRRKCLQTA